jgi:hypothetical protein
MERFEDGLNDAIGLGQDLAVPEPQNPETLRPQETITLCIVRSRVDVLAAVEFDHEAGFGTNEIANVGADYVLTSELEASELTTA